MKEYLPRTDLVVEICDARIPKASRNPLISEIFSDKPKLIILNKADLADPSVTKDWINYFEKDPKTKVLAVSCTTGENLSKVIPACHALAEHRNKGKRIAMNALVAGVPNSGKSSFINALNKQKKASVQNKPGHTKEFQLIKLSPQINLIDTPGLLWPKFEDPDTGYGLAILGSIKDEILELTDIAANAMEIIISRYGEGLIKRYNLDSIASKPWEGIEQIGRKRGFLIKGGGIDYDRTCEMLLKELRSGKLGRISLENPKNCHSL